MIAIRRSAIYYHVLLFALAIATALLAACAAPVEYDIVLRGGTIYDGTGSPGVAGDIAIDGDTIVAMGDLGKAEGRTEIDVRGHAVAPGFINMLSWATESLIEDGLAQSDIRQKPPTKLPDGRPLRSEGRK